MKKMKFRKNWMKSSWARVHSAVARAQITNMKPARTPGVTFSAANGSITVTVDMKAPYRLNTLIAICP
ncbi:hypothetical protein D3C76_488630 [compost metagenome]